MQQSAQTVYGLRRRSTKRSSTVHCTYLYEFIVFCFIDFKKGEASQFVFFCLSPQTPRIFFVNRFVFFLISRDKRMFFQIDLTEISSKLVQQLRHKFLNVSYTLCLNKLIIYLFNLSAFEENTNVKVSNFAALIDLITDEPRL